MEDLEFTDTGAHIGKGNSLDNKLTGNEGVDTLIGGAGNDTLKGGLSADILMGGFGNDTYIIEQVGGSPTEIVEFANQGIDTILTDDEVNPIDLATVANIENVIAFGTGAFNFTGNELANLLVGGDEGDTLTGNGGDDTLNGKADGFADVLRGNDGDDTYIIDELGEDIAEQVGEGVDTIKTSLGVFALPVFLAGKEFENLVFTGTGSFTGIGNTLANTITGGDQDDTLDGGTNADTLIGGKGDDTYMVDNAGDQVTEKLNEGTDTIETSLVTFTLGANIENLTYSPFVPASFNGTGNALNNIIIGGILADTLTGLDGNDRLDGGAGVDTMIGGNGNDTYIVDDLSEVTTSITELAGQGVDTIEISATGGVTLAANVENMTYTGSSAWTGIGGNELNNIITGGSLGNEIFGGLGNDTLIGGNGVDDLHGNQGNDTLLGGANIDTLNGDEGNDILDGGLGDDTMNGGDGNDLYKVDSLGDTVVDLSGIDTAEVTANGTLATPYVTPGGIETVKFTGSGSFFVSVGGVVGQVIIGGDGNDHFENSNDVTLIGGKGDDTYVMGSTFGTIVEKVGEGKDTVEIGSGVASYTLGANIENLTHTSATAFAGTGNALDNVITGGGGSNTLTGLGGNDRLISTGGLDILVGGKGDDVYIEDTTKCTITELAGEGTDTLATVRQNITE